MSKYAPYSLQHVHCAHCEPCENPSECPAATRRDDLKKHTSTHHSGKISKVIGDEKQLKIRGFFSSVLSPTQPSTSTAGNVVYSESIQHEESSDEFPPTVTSADVLRT